ncbi:MAG: bacteriohemerythrin [Candidatus Paceibacterota bacterium]|jgi:hemerythrin
MEKFIWKDEYSVGIKLLDEQHKDFFSITNSIIDLLDREDVKKEDLVAMLHNLEAHGFEHLKTEEGYFDTFNYPHAPDHIKEHDFFRKRIDHYNSELEKPDVDTKKLADEIVTYGVHWLSDHILLMDKHYTVFLKGHGIQ